MKKALLALALASIASNAMAAIAGSPHDLSPAGANSATYPGGTLSSCQYCHAPHRSNTAVAGAPLWNRNSPTTVFTPYTSNTFNGTAQPGINSLTCLSCHDGVTDLGATFTGTQGFGGTVRVMARATAIIGADLRNDHPVGMRYISSNEYRTVAAVTGSGLKLYGAAGSETVECGSCHEPHNADFDNAPGGRSYLRVASSVICSNCHLK
jgi:hypothetical protein